jgi:hypothetical protein
MTNYYFEHSNFLKQYCYLHPNWIANSILQLNPLNLLSQSNLNVSIDCYSIIPLLVLYLNLNQDCQLDYSDIQALFSDVKSSIPF